jgi:hypothetical protein
MLLLMPCSDVDAGPLSQASSVHAAAVKIWGDPPDVHCAVFTCTCQQGIGASCGGECCAAYNICVACRHHSRRPGLVSARHLVACPNCILAQGDKLLHQEEAVRAPAVLSAY